MVYIIGKYEICEDTFELRYNGDPQKIEPLILKLLLFMFHNPDKVLTRDEIIDQVWDARFISDSALSAAICAARRAIGDSGKEQKHIKTIVSKGYRFIADFTIQKHTKIRIKPKTITTHTLSSQKRQEATPLPTEISLLVDNTEKKSTTLPDQPSLAIMNFIDLGSSKESALFAYALTAEINATISRLPHLFVIARASSAHLSTQNLPPKEISLRLGVRYLVYANTERLDKRIRVTLSIIDAVENTEIWSEHYDRALDDLFLVQNEMTQDIVHGIDSAIEYTEIKRAFQIPSENLSAWETYHQAVWHLGRTKEQNVQTAHALFNKAIDIDNRFARAYACLSIIHTSSVLLDITPSPQETLKRAHDLAQQSLHYDQHEAMAYSALARSYLLSQQHQQGLESSNHGLQLNPNNLHCLGMKTLITSLLGLDKQALILSNKVIHLSPYDPVNFSMHIAQATSYIHQEQYSKAVKLSIKAADDSNSYFTVQAITSSILNIAGLPELAKKYARKALKLKPDYSVEVYLRLMPHTDEFTRNQFISSMVKAGIPRYSNRYQP